SQDHGKADARGRRTGPQRRSVEYDASGQRSDQGEPRFRTLGGPRRRPRQRRIALRQPEKDGFLRAEFARGRTAEKVDSERRNVVYTRRNPMVLRTAHALAALYETDETAWLEETAELVRNGP